MKEILLVGNPNSGKTTLFNALTKSNEHVGNWHGVTVEEKRKLFMAGRHECLLVDTPGLYSLSPLSFEEKVACDIIETEDYQKIINLCDYNNLERSLYLSLCLMEEGHDIVIVINQMDKKRKNKVDIKKLGKMLGVPVFLINAKKKWGVDALLKYIEQDINENKKEVADNEKVTKNKGKIVKNCRNCNKNCSKNNFWQKNRLKIEKILKKSPKMQNDERKNGENIEKNVKNDYFFNKKTIFYGKKYNLEYIFAKELDFDCEYFVNMSKLDKKVYLIKAFEKNRDFFKAHGFSEEKIDKLFALVPHNSMENLAQVRYDYIDKVKAECFQKYNFVYGKCALDKILLNKFLSFPCFILILMGIFYLTFFSLGRWLSSVLAWLLSLISSPILAWLLSLFGDGFIYNLFDTAIFGGVGMVLSFLPQIVLLFFFLSVLEDSGYLSRVAFLFEDILGKIGLSGKSVYTLLMGFGCSTSAIMTSRNMDDKNSKIKTALICPYMSCSAKIPIYTVVGGAFFGANNIFCIMGLYFLGVLVAILVSKILNSTMLKSENQTFILEFPPYRAISLSRAGRVLWANVKNFLVKVGSVMVSMNVVVFILSSVNLKLQYVDSGSGSILQVLGQVISPIFSPLGFGSWAIVSALLAGVIAKEVVVSSIAMFNGIDAGASALISSSLLLSTSVVHFSSVSSVLSFLTFCLLYTPCIASISVMSQEIGAKWTAFGVILELLVAYVVSFIVYNVSFAIEIFGFWSVFFVVLSALIVLFASLFIVKKIRHSSCAYCDKNCHKN